MIEREKLRKAARGVETPPDAYYHLLAPKNNNISCSFTHCDVRLRKRGLLVETENPISVLFEEVDMDCGYRADIVVEGKVVVDTKTIEAIGDLEIAQVLTYLKFLSLRYGLILNFKVKLMKYGIRRVIRGY